MNRKSDTAAAPSESPSESLAGFPPEVRDSVAELPPMASTETVTKWAGYSTPGLYKAMAAGRFPRPVKLGPNRVVWLRSDLAQWLAGRVAVRTAAAAAAEERAGRHAEYAAGGAA